MYKTIFSLLVSFFCFFYQGNCQFRNIVFVGPDIEGCNECKDASDAVFEKMSIYFYNSYEFDNWESAKPNEDEIEELWGMANYILTCKLRRNSNNDYIITFFFRKKNGEIINNAIFDQVIDDTHFDNSLSDIVTKKINPELEFFRKHKIFKTIVKVHDFKSKGISSLQLKDYSIWITFRLNEIDSLGSTHAFYYQEYFINNTDNNINGNLLKDSTNIDNTNLMTLVMFIEIKPNSKKCNEFIVDLDQYDKNKDSIVREVYKKLKSN